MAESDVISKADLDKYYCTVCLELFKSPKILPCLHTFCEECINGIILSTVRKDSHQFSCPICHAVVKISNGYLDITKWTSELKNNNAISTLISELKIRQTKQCDPCIQHEKISEGTFWCKECYEYFCYECNKIHGSIRVSKFHHVISVKTTEDDSAEINLRDISENCRIHPLNKIEAFCFDHDELCCLRCLTSLHRKCDNVKAFSEISETNGRKGKFEDILEQLKLRTQKLLKDKEGEADTLLKGTKTIENEAEDLVQRSKSKLDNLFRVFTKQLNTFRDEQNTEIQVSIRKIKSFINKLDHWLKVTKVVREKGSESQLFFFIKSMKDQIKSHIKQFDIICSSDAINKCIFDCSKTVKTLLEDETLGEIKMFKRSLDEHMLDLNTVCYQYGINIEVKFQEASAKKIRNIHIPGSELVCGATIDASHFVVGDMSEPAPKKLLVINKNGNVTNRLLLQGNPELKRLCYDQITRRLFVSCYGGKLLMTPVRELTLEQLTPLSFLSEFIGALCANGENIYIVMNGAINYFKSSIEPTSMAKMNCCFATNTYSGLNGLAAREDKLIYTTKDKEIKCTYKTGQQCFRFKEDTLKKPECLTVTTSGLILTVDSSDCGSLHLISQNGNSSRILLNKFEKIKSPLDIWLGFENQIYVCGGEYIEVYMLVPKQMQS